jgi:hypothetical protein
MAGPPGSQEADFRLLARPEIKVFIVLYAQEQHIVPRRADAGLFRCRA